MAHRDENSPNDVHQPSANRRRTLRIFVALALESFFWTAFKLPETQSFDAYAFGDNGSNYTAQYLMRQGAVPTVDFAWIYGLLPLEFGRVWTFICGNSPGGYHLSLILGHIVLLAGMARFLAAMEVTKAGIAFVIVTMPHWLATSYPNWTHLLEACLLVHALAAQACRRNGIALALVTASLFVKPSMAYVYGAWLVLWIFVEIFNDRERVADRILKSFAPAALTGLILGSYFSARYGVGPVLESLWPRTAMKIYQAGNFGFFFGIGRNFWMPQGVRIGYYFGGIVAVWLLSSVVLIVYSAKVVLGILRSRKRPNYHDLSILTCAVLHITFVTLFFGPQTSWFYYCFVLIMGVANLGSRGRRWDWLVVGLTGLGLLSLWSTVNSQIGLWKTTSPSSSTLGLWAKPEEARAWTQALERCKGLKTVLICGVGDADLTTDGFLPPVSCYLSPGMEDTPDAIAKEIQMKHAEAIIVPLVWGANVQHILEWPRLKSALTPFKTDSRDSHFLVLKRSEVESQ